ncbi:MAG: NAD(P)H-dependent glycerol-3-phosphate dehydrogenase [Candidatus Methanofastidiosum methylothiophilum]|uniref:NAD(P)H-dependent glycerol-3-phosphate dehydrogenase n=1 Tax=Candidatus Methanofastidiosum methylothiophilum TaxID=1705564 RepID=A0A150JA15_9EURY|nr:MAG: NAD(P)H-dependent glycerol-3-phosphate dehydrogenase [Candidatus Methanofastidiosum methylthiophilus]NMC77277.1 NADP transhydrogenase subunit alpha [Candidatus Methanofastidiosa archaeon]
MVERLRNEIIDKIRNTTSNKPSFCVIGAGNGGLAMAGYLAINDFSVNIWTRDKEKMEALAQVGGIEVEGKIEGFGKINKIDKDFQKSIEDVDIIMVVIPANGHREIGEKLVKYVKRGQSIVLNPGRTGGALEIYNMFRREGKIREDITIAETQTFLFVSRKLDVNKVKIFDIKRSVPVSAVRSYKNPEIIKKLRTAFPQFTPTSDVFHTSLGNVAVMFHPAVMLLNTGWIESNHGNFEYYLEGISPGVAKVLEHVDIERVKIAEALGIRVPTLKDWLYFSYGSTGHDLYESVQVTPAYKGVMAPSSIHHRYILEDVPMSLVPMSSIGKKFGVETKCIDSLINIACCQQGRDFWVEGRTVDHMGIKKFDLKTIKRLVAGEIV